MKGRNLKLKAHCTLQLLNCWRSLIRLDQGASAETTRRYRSVHLAVVVSRISEDFLCQARVTVAILLIVHG